jgi:hypothetical protein
MLSWQHVDLGEDAFIGDDFVLGEDAVIGDGFVLVSSYEW